MLPPFASMVVADGSSNLFPEWFVNHPWVLFLGATCTVLSIPLALYAIWLTFRLNRVKLPRYSVRNFNILAGEANKLPSLEIKYAGHAAPLQHLSVAKVLFWNGGRDTITDDDLDATKPFSIVPSAGNQILDALIVFVKDTANKIAFDKVQDGSRVFLTFDHLDKDEGGILQIVHTGVSGKDLTIEGKIKGAGQPVRIAFGEIPVLPFRRFRRNRRFRKSFGVFALLVPFVMWFLWISELFLSEAAKPYQYATLAACILTSVVYWSLAYLVLIRRIPKGYDQFEEPF